MIKKSCIRFSNINSSVSCLIMHEFSTKIQILFFSSIWYIICIFLKYRTKDMNFRIYIKSEICKITNLWQWASPVRFLLITEILTHCHQGPTDLDLEVQNYYRKDKRNMTSCWRHADVSTSSISSCRSSSAHWRQYGASGLGWFDARTHCEQKGSGAAPFESPELAHQRASAAAEDDARRPCDAEHVRTSEQHQEEEELTTVARDSSGRPEEYWRRWNLPRRSPAGDGGDEAVPAISGSPGQFLRGGGRGRCGGAPGGLRFARGCAGRRHDVASPAAGLGSLHGNDRGKRPSCWSEERIRERGGRPGSYLLAGGGAVARIVAPDRVVASAATELLAERRKKTKQILQIPPGP
jgi:hypothetical protein